MLQILKEELKLYKIDNLPVYLKLENKDLLGGGGFITQNQIEGDITSKEEKIERLKSLWESLIRYYNEDPEGLERARRYSFKFNQPTELNVPESVDVVQEAILQGFERC